MGEQARDELAFNEAQEQIESMIRLPSGEFLDMRTVKATKRSDREDRRLIVLLANGPKPVIFSYAQEDGDMILAALGTFYHFDPIRWKREDTAILESGE